MLPHLRCFGDTSSSEPLDLWSDATCVVLVLSAQFPNSLRHILQKDSNLLLWAVRSPWTRITMESTVQEHLIFSRARKHQVPSQLRCYSDTSFEVVWSEIQWHLSSLCAREQCLDSLGAFLQKTIQTIEEVLGHKSNGSEDLVSPKHLRCGSTWYSYIQENMMSSFILDATVIRASRSLDMGSKGIWVVFVQIVYNSQTH